MVGPIAGAKVADIANSASPIGCFAFGSSVMMSVKAISVITAVEIAPGTARRRSAYWQAMADTAIIAAVPARTPAGSADVFVMTLKINSAASTRN